MAMRLDRMANVAAANGKQAAEAGNGVLIDRTHHVTLVEVGWRSGFEYRGQVAVLAAAAVAVSVWRNIVLQRLLCNLCVFCNEKYCLFFCFCFVCEMFFLFGPVLHSLRADDGSVVWKKTEMIMHAPVHILNTPAHSFSFF